MIVYHGTMSVNYVPDVLHRGSYVTENLELARFYWDYTYSIECNKEDLIPDNISFIIGNYKTNKPLYINRLECKEGV